jgi:glucan phosphoethanolaminetransferase (alkaline phosphatase superfamily)
MLERSEGKNDSRQVQIKATIGLLLVVALFFWLQPGFLDRLAGVSTLMRKAVFSLVFLAALGALLSCVLAPRLCAIPALGFFSINLLIDTSFAMIKGRPSTLVDAQLMSENFGNIGDVLSQFTPAVAKVTLAIAALWVLILWGRILVRRRTSLPLLVSTASVSGFYFVLLLAKGEQALVGFPSNFTPALGAMVLTLDHVSYRLVHRTEKALSLEEVPLVPRLKHIVMVIDESIEGCVFEGLLKSNPMPRARDLGIGYSYANCSAASNLMLRRGMDPNDPDRSLRQFPSLFQIAQRHGFTTAYLDVQGVLTDSSVHDYFDEREVSHINRIYDQKMFGQLVYRQDLNSVKILADFLNTHVRTFTIIQKRGSHFPYANNLAPELSEVKDPYGTSIQQNTIGFLQSIGAILPEGTIVFFTSDHGQNFMTEFPHGNLPGECCVNEWVVPILVLYSQDMAGFAERIAPAWQDRASHAVMTETIRNLLGSRNSAGSSLLIPPAGGTSTRSRAFYGSPHGLFGRNIPFLLIDTDKMTLRRAVP